MRIKNLLHVAATVIMGQLLFGCSSADYYRISATKMEAYNTVKEKPAPAEIAEAPVALAITSADKQAEKTPEAPVLEASTAPAAPAALRKKATEIVKAPAVEQEATLEKREMTVAEAEALTMVNERLANMTKLEKKELKSDLKEAYRQRGSRTSIVEIVLAVLLPPLAVFLHDGIGTSFWISIILTLLFYIPGIIYALLVVTDTI